MRPWESYYIYACFACVCYPCIFTLSLCTLILLIHLIMEFPRWQLIPSYLVLPLSFFLCFDVPDRSWSRYGLELGIGGTLLMGASALACLLPIVHFPKVENSGIHRVGMEEYHVRADRQNFLVRIFYPTNAVLAKSIPYFKHGFKGTSYFAKFANLPALIFSHMSLFKLSVIEHADIIGEKDGKFGKKLPLIIFSHGLGGTYECYSSLVLEYASHGYIVAVILHHDKSASYVEFPNGDATHYLPASAEQLKSFELGFEFRNSQLKHRSHECCVLINYLSEFSNTLTRGTSDHPRSEKFFERIDLSRIAIAGHSFGLIL